LHRRLYAVSHGDLDLGLAAGEHHERGVAVLPLFTDELVAVVSSSHPLAARSHLEADDLRNETYITYSRVTEYGLEDDLLFRPSRIAPAHLVEASTVDVILDLVACGLGFTIISRWAVTTAPQRAKLAALPLTGSGLKVSWSALVREADARDPQVEALLKMLDLPGA
jgi:LysR family transcriptional regulator for metE and metH